MKHFNFKPDAQLIKLSLVGTLLAALGTSVSFNPATLTIARNEALVSGSTSLASTNMPSCTEKMKTQAERITCTKEYAAKVEKAKTQDEKNKLAEELKNANNKSDAALKEVKAKAEVKPKAHGGTGARKAAAKPEAKKEEAQVDAKEKVKTEASSEEVKVDPVNGKVIKNAIWEKKAGKVFFEVDCKSCKIEGEVHSLDVANLTNIEAVKMAIIENMQKEKDAKSSEAKSSDEKTADTKTADKKKKEEVEDVNETLAKSECPELSDDNSNVADMVSCQKDELKAILTDCKEQESTQSKSKEKIAEKAKVSCTKIVKNYFNKFVKPVMQAGLTSSPEMNRAAHSAGQAAVTMMLGGKVIPSRFVTVELAHDIDVLVRQADMALTQRAYTSVYNSQSSSITMCQLRNAAANLSTGGCGTVNDAAKLASIAAGQYLNGLQSGGPFADGTILSATAMGLMGQNPDFMAQFQTQYVNPMQTLSTLFSTGQNARTANDLLQNYLTNPDASVVTLNPNGTITIGQNPTVVTQPSGVPSLTGRGGRNDLQIPYQQIPGAPVVQAAPVTQNPVINVPAATQPVGSRSAFH